MRRLIVILTVLFTIQVSAEDLKLRDVFKQMPDSLMPYLSQNNRLDFIDFLDSNMKAEVHNQLGGVSEMTALTDDSLIIQMSKTLRIDMLLLKLPEPVDTMTQAVVMIETFHVDSIHGESRISYYSPDWKQLPECPPFNEKQMNRIQQIKLQNILKKDDELLNKD